MLGFGRIKVARWDHWCGSGKEVGAMQFQKRVEHVEEANAHRLADHGDRSPSAAFNRLLDRAFVRFFVHPPIYVIVYLT